MYTLLSIILAALLQLPFHGMTELNKFVQDNNGETGQGVCPNGSQFLVVEVERGATFLRALVSEKRFIVVEFVGEDNDKNQAFLGVVDKDGNFTVSEVVSVSNAAERFPRGCDYLSPTQS